eukprot:CAMPEP_0184742896 /NCGR_PEP_ID=MMETSP0315-20130426/5843_1 /TAXON_ID=101924 /ORGANISM="Rhodosorus marinus, Strain UTEX LB 2760" /LENGTH=1220 /DNA_ID=CAMNT_0027213965 /DNA_START=410 /DNA_END=4072 /DNA_ORIENTATION=+
MATDERQELVEAKPQNKLTIYAPYFYVLDFSQNNTETTTLLGGNTFVEIYGFYVMIKGKAGVTASMKGTTLFIFASIIDIQSDGSFALDVSGLPVDVAPPTVPPALPLPAPAPRFSGQPGKTGVAGHVGGSGTDGNPGGKFIMITKHLNLTSLHSAGHDFTIINDGSAGSIGGKGGPGQTGGTGASGVSCSLNSTKFGKNDDPNCCKFCHASFAKWERCNIYQAGQPGAGGPGGPGGPGGRGAGPGWVSVYSNSASGADNKPIDNDTVEGMILSTSKHGEVGLGGSGGDGGAGAHNDPNALCTTYTELLPFVMKYQGRASVNATGLPGPQGPSGINGTTFGDVRPKFIRATVNSTGNPYDGNHYEYPQDWVYLQNVEPVEYLGFGLELSENMLNTLAYVDDDAGAQNTYNLILQSVSDMMYNAQLMMNRTSDSTTKKLYASYVNKAWTLIKSINRVSSPGGSPLGQVSIASFEQQLDDLVEFRDLAEVLEGYYAEYAKEVNNTATSERILLNATNSSLVGVQQQVTLQQQIYKNLAKMNETLDDVALKIQMTKFALNADQQELDECWEEAQKALMFQKVMDFVSFVATVADFGLGATKLVGQASQLISEGGTFFKGINTASGFKYSSIPTLIKNIQQLVPGPGQSSNWDPYASSMKLVEGDESSLAGYEGGLSSALEGIYHADNYADAQEIFQKMNQTADDYKSARISMAKEEVTDKVNAMKSACPGQAQEFFRTFDTLQMWVNQRNDLLAVYTALVSYFNRVTAKKLYLESVAQNTLVELQQNTINPASLAVLNVHQETYNMMVDQFSKNLALVLNARSYLMMGAASSSLSSLSFANCRWETSIMKDSNNMFFKCAANAVLQLKNALSQWHTSTYSQNQLVDWMSYWGPVELNEESIGPDRWADFKKTGILNFCLDPTEPSFNRGPGMSAGMFFPLISMDSIFVVMDGAPEEGVRVDIQHMASSGVVRAMENPTSGDSAHPYLTKKFTHVDRDLRFIYSGEAPGDDKVSMLAWMKSTNISVRADVGDPSEILRISPFSNYQIETDVGVLEDVSNVRVYYTGHYVPAADFNILPISSLSETIMCTSTLAKPAATPTPTTSPPDTNKVTAEGKDLKSYSASAELVRRHELQDGSYTEACRISFEFPVGGQRPEHVKLEWEWEQYQEGTNWEYSNEISMAINGVQAIVTFNNTPEAVNKPTHAVLLTDSCPTNLRVVSQYTM